MYTALSYSITIVEVIPTVKLYHQKSIHVLLHKKICVTLSSQQRYAKFSRGMKTERLGWDTQALRPTCMRLLVVIGQLFPAWFHICVRVCKRVTV